MKTYVSTASSPPTPGVPAAVRRISGRIAAAIRALLGRSEKRPKPDRVVLPMSSGSNVPPNTLVQVTARPQNVAFRPERIVIGGEPANWIVHDIKVGNCSQFSQGGHVPGELFAASAADSLLSLDIVCTAMDFTILVTYVGPDRDGAPFVCGVMGSAAI